MARVGYVIRERVATILFNAFSQQVYKQTTK